MKESLFAMSLCSSKSTWVTAKGNCLTTPYFSARKGPRWSELLTLYKVIVKTFLNIIITMIETVLLEKVKLLS